MGYKYFFGNRPDSEPVNEGVEKNERNYRDWRQAVQGVRG